jgi:hypothetical protein
MPHKVCKRKDAHIEGKRKLRHDGENQSPRKRKQGNSPKLPAAQEGDSQRSSQNGHKKIFAVYFEGSESHTGNIARGKNWFEKNAADGEKKEGVIKQPNSKKRKLSLSEHQGSEDGNDFHVAGGNPELGCHGRSSEGQKIHPLVSENMKKIEPPRNEIGVPQDEEDGILGIPAGSAAKTIDAPGDHDGPSLHHHMPYEKIVPRKGVEKEEKSEDFQGQFHRFPPGRHVEPPCSGLPDTANRRFESASRIG